jgi:hypothetical protein
MKVLWLCAVLCTLACWRCAGQEHAPPQSEFIEMRAVLFSDCLPPQQKTEPADLWPVRVVYVRIQTADSHATVEYREFDGNCKRAAARSAQWSAEQFANAKARLSDAGIRDGLTIAPPESSGNDLPISFLKVRSRGLNGDIYTMYLRSRWSGKMGTDDPVVLRVLKVWQSLLLEATPEKPKQSAGREGLIEVARDSAKQWPSDLRPWIWSELRKAGSSGVSGRDCLAQMPPLTH